MPPSPGKRPNLAAELGPRHPWVIDARAQVRNAQQLIKEELTRVAEATRNDYERALANEGSLASSLDALKRKAMDSGLVFVKLRELEQESEASRAVYEVDSSAAPARCASKSASTPPTYASCRTRNRRRIGPGRRAG